MKILLSTILIFFSISALAFAKAAPHTKEIQYYLEVQKALVIGDFASFNNSAKSLLNSTGKTSAELSKEIKELAEVSSLKQARQEFKDVSALLIKKNKNSLKDGLIIVYCPMAGAKWIQEEGKIQNPYMEKDMTECGEKI